MYPDVESIPVTARSKAWVCCRWLAGIAGSNTAGGMDDCHVSVACLPGTVLCFGLITRPEESYRLWCVPESKTSKKGRPSGGGGIRCMGHIGRPTFVT